MSDPYAAHAEFIRPAEYSSDLWRVVLMLIGFEVVFAFSPTVFTAFLPTDAMVTAYFEGTTAFGTLAQFASFGIALFGFVILLPMLHGRGFRSVVGPSDAATRDLTRVGLAVAAWLLLIEVLPPWVFTPPQGIEPPEMRDLGLWFVFIPLTVMVLLIQVGTEEVFFRGYLQQQCACLSDSRWVWMGVPSFLFGALHYWNGNGAADGIIWAIWAGFLGLACADLTARTGNIGAAIGLHMANNAFALLVVSIEGWPSSGVALFVYPYEDPANYSYGASVVFTAAGLFQLFTMLLTVKIMWLAARLALRR